MTGAGAVDLLFVYGTLQRGQPHAALLSDCRCLGPARIRGTLYALPEGFPAADAGGTGVVEGELYELPPYADLLLRMLDEYEGVDEGLFERRRVKVGGREAWTYVAGPALRPALAGRTPLPGGRWPARGDIRPG